METAAGEGINRKRSRGSAGRDEGGGGGGGGGWRQRNEVNAKKAVTLNSLRLKISSAGFSVRAPESRSHLLMIIQRKQRARHHVHAPDSKVSTFLLQARLTQNR